eukprot:6207773-Pleurochrysis_carterae.AAC.1
MLPRLSATPCHTSGESARHMASSQPVSCPPARQTISPAWPSDPPVLVRQRAAAATPLAVYDTPPP